MIRTREIEAQNDLLEYQIALVDTLNGTEKLDKLKDNLAATQALVAQTRDSLSGTSIVSANSYIDSILKDLNSGKETVEKLDERIKDLKRRSSLLGNSGSDAAQQANIAASIAKIEKALEFYRTSLKLTGEESIEELIKLSGQVDEETKKKIDSLVEYEKQLKDLSESISESLLGFSSKSMIDEVTNLFAQGKISAKDFADTLEGFMKKAIINSLRVRFLETELTALTDEMEKTADANMEKAEKAGIEDASLFSDEDVKKFQDRYNDIVEKGQKKLEAWEKATGLDFGENASSSLSAGVIRGITETTGSELLGIYRAIYEKENKNLTATIEGNIDRKSALEMGSSHLASLNGIQINTAETVKRLDTAVSHLDKIVKNTSQQSTRAYTG